MVFTLPVHQTIYWTCSENKNATHTIEKYSLTRVLVISKHIIRLPFLRKLLRVLLME